MDLAGEIWAAAQAEARTRAADMPTEQRAIDSLFSAWYRLKEMGWKEAYYAPADRSPLEVIECGSTGVHRGFRDEERRFWVEDGGDLYPIMPVLFRPYKRGGLP